VTFGTGKSLTLVFSNGEPPMLSQNSFAGETVRVWELTGPPFGVDDEKLIDEIVSTVMENFGHAVEHFVLNYLNLKDEFKNPGSFLPPDKINSLSNAERRRIVISHWSLGSYLKCGHWSLVINSCMGAWVHGCMDAWMHEVIGMIGWRPCEAWTNKLLRRWSEIN
jgi:hypothetical protein